MTGNHFIFDPNGHLLSSTKDERFFQETRSKKDRKMPSLARYRLQNTIWDTVILRDAEGGVFKPIVKTPLPLWPIRLIMPTFAIIGTGLLGRAIARRPGKKTGDSVARE